MVFNVWNLNWYSHVSREKNFDLKSFKSNSEIILYFQQYRQAICATQPHTSWETMLLMNR